MLNGVNSKARNLEIQRWIAGLLFLLLIDTSTSVAQLPTATILGVVKDASGAVVPGASLTARSVETGQTRTTVTAADGSYRFPGLAVGGYEVRVEHPGFQSTVRSGLTLAVSQEAVVNMTLQVGAVEQTVAVTAEAPLVNTTSGSLGGLVGEEKIADLPLNGRNYIDLSLMQMGVSEQRSHGSGGGLVGTYFSSNGATVRPNSYLLDGAILTNIGNATSSSVSNSTLGVEGIREYRVITNSFSAEYGMVMGSQMIIVSKGGTNNFHGSLFEYLRNSVLDARNFFDYKSAASQRRLPAYVRNNFGVSFGGPIKKDKTFFHGVFERLKDRLGVTTVYTVPAAACHGAGGTTITNTACPQLAATASVTVNPVITSWLGLYPTPNLPNNQFTYPYRQPTNENYGQMRVDQNFTSNDTMFGRYTIDDTQLTQTVTYPQFQVSLVSRGQFATASENHVFSPVLLNTARVSLSRTVLAYSDVDDPPSGPGISLVPGWPISGLAIGGITTLGANGNGPFQRKQNIFTYSDDLFYTRGRHSLKFGALVNHYQQLLGNFSYGKGSITFTNLASFLNAQPNLIGSVKLPGSSSNRTIHYNTLGFYAQDDLRVRSNLTLNLGLRYELNTVPQEQHGQWSHLNLVQQDTQFTVDPALYLNPSLKNFSPRFGFAWDVKGNGKTAVRGGFGLLYDIAQVSNGVLFWGMSAQLPFTTTVKLQNPPLTTIPIVFPSDAGILAPQAYDYHMKQPHLLQYNLTVEQQLPFDMALTLAYADSRGINLNNVQEENPNVSQVLLDGRRFWPLGAKPINPNWGTLSFFTTAADSWYSALQFGLIKRLGKGLQFQSSYTWSRMIDVHALQTKAEQSLAEA